MGGGWRRKKKAGSVRGRKEKTKNAGQRANESKRNCRCLLLVLSSTFLLLHHHLPRHLHRDLGSVRALLPPFMKVEEREGTKEHEEEQARKKKRSTSADDDERPTTSADDERKKKASSPPLFF